MRIVYAGTPEFAVPALQACMDQGADVVRVLTQPDRPAGRGRKLQASPVKLTAEAAGLSVWQPERLDDDIVSRLSSEPVDLMIVAAYGMLLPPSILSWPRLGCVNIHASILPRWRGASPIQHAVLHGDATSGLTLMQMDEGLDTGDILMVDEIPIDATDTAGDLHDRLTARSAALMSRGLDGLASGTLKPRPQDDAKATYAPRITKADARLDFTRTAAQLSLAVRAWNPWPVAWAMLDDEPVRIWTADVVDAGREAEPGTIVAADAEGVVIQTGDKALRALDLQFPGRRRMTAAEVATGRSLDGRRFN